MKRTNRAPLLIAGALLLLASSSSATSSSATSSSGSSGSGGPGRRPTLPRPLGAPPSSSSSSSSSSITGSTRGTGGDGVIDVSRPVVREYSTAELAAMRARSSAHKTSPGGATAAGTVRASPELEPRHGSTPAGYNPAQARSRASAIARHLSVKGPKAYSRELLKEWQQFAGLHIDGVYAGSSRGALVFYGVDNPPRPFAQPVATLPYHPPDYEP